MRVMVRQALKKIKDAGGLEGTPAATNNETGGAAATPKKRGRKTKDVDGNDTEKPAPKKGRGKKKALKAELVYDGKCLYCLTSKLRANTFTQRMRLSWEIWERLSLRRPRTPASEHTSRDHASNIQRLAGCRRLI